MRFTKDHQWVVVDGDLATVGVSAWRGEYLADAVQVNLPDAGAVLKAGEPWAEVETVDKPLKLTAPIDGQIAEINERLNNEPELIDTSPEKLAWFAKLKVADPKQVEALMDRDAYEAYLDTL